MVFQQIQKLIATNQEVNGPRFDCGANAGAVVLNAERPFHVSACATSLRAAVPLIGANGRSMLQLRLRPALRARAIRGAGECGHEDGGRPHGERASPSPVPPPVPSRTSTSLTASGCFYACPAPNPLPRRPAPAAVHRRADADEPHRVGELVKRMVGRVLNGNGITEVQQGRYRLIGSVAVRLLRSR